MKKMKKGALVLLMLALVLTPVLSSLAQEKAQEATPELQQTNTIPPLEQAPGLLPEYAIHLVGFCESSLVKSIKGDGVLNPGQRMCQASFRLLWIKEPHWAKEAENFQGQPFLLSSFYLTPEAASLFLPGKTYAIKGFSDQWVVSMSGHVGEFNLPMWQEIGDGSGEVFIALPEDKPFVLEVPKGTVDYESWLNTQPFFAQSMTNQ